MTFEKLIQPRKISRLSPELNRFLFRLTAQLTILFLFNHHLSSRSFKIIHSIRVNLLVPLFQTRKNTSIPSSSLLQSTCFVQRNLKIKLSSLSHLSRNKTHCDWKEKRMESVQTSSPQRGRADYTWFVPWCVSDLDKSREMKSKL